MNECGQLARSKATRLFFATNKRGSREIMKDYKEVIEDIKEDSYLRFLWKVYLKENKYIGDLTFDKIVDAAITLSNRINEM